MSNEEGSMSACDKRVKKAAERLRELKASGADLSEILGGPVGASFVRDDCDGDPDIAYTAFALVHSPKYPGER